MEEKKECCCVCKGITARERMECKDVPITEAHTTEETEEEK